MSAPVRVWRCIGRHTFRCPGDTTGAMPKRCPACKGQVHSRSAWIDVVPWRGDGRYSHDQAVRTYQSRVLAERYASAHLVDNVVVRFTDAGATA